MFPGPSHDRVHRGCPTKNIESTDILTLQYYQFGALWRDLRSTRRVRDWLGYTFGPPGWEPGAGATQIATRAGLD